MPAKCVFTAKLLQHGAGKQAVPRFLRDDAYRDAVLGIGARHHVLHENVAPLQVALQPRQQRAEILSIEGTVVLSPPDLLFGGLLAHYELIGRGARRVLAGAHHQRTQVRHAAFGAEDALLI